MTVGIDDGKFYLIDKFPGVPTNGPNPASWTTYSATEDFPVGTKRMIYDDTNNGWATLIYLRFQKGSAAVATVKSICGLYITDVATAGAWYNVTNTADSTTSLIGPICVALGTTTDAYYGWFWCGGVCPVDTISGLNGIYPSSGTVAACNGMQLVAASSLCTFTLIDANTGANGIGLGAAAFALAVDTTA
jgi:hypothetical protein